MKPLLPFVAAIASFVGALLAPSTRADVFVSFEPEEGFTPGGRNNTAGWSIPNSTRTRVSDGTEPAFDGQYSIYLGPGGNSTSIRNENLAQASEGYNIYSYSVISPENAFTENAHTSWVYIQLYDAASETTRTVQLMTRYGSNPNQIRLGYTARYTEDSVITYYKAINLTDIDLASWNTFTAVFDYEQNTYSIFWNGVEFLSNIILPEQWQLTGITGTWLISPTNEYTTTYYDAILLTRSIPEPAAASLLMLAGGLLLSVNRCGAVVRNGTPGNNINRI